MPAFLRDLDRQLLLYCPALWAMKIHWVIFFVGIAASIMTIKAIIPLSLMSLPSSEEQFLWAFIPASLFFFFWVKQLSDFNTEKHFGRSSFFQRLGRQALLLGGVILITAIPFVHAQLSNHHIAQAVDDTSFMEDINSLNMGDVYFPLSEVDYRIFPEETFSPGFIYKNLDASELILKHKRLTNEDKLQLVHAYQALIKKYSGYEYVYSAQQILTAYQQQEMILSRDNQAIYQAVAQTTASLKRIAQAKDRTYPFQTAEDVHKVVFFVFVLWLAVVIFFQTSLKQLLITCSLYVLGMMMLGVLMSISTHFFSLDDEPLVFLCFFAALSILSLQAFITGHSQRTHYWQSIGLSLASMLLPLTVLVWTTTLSVAQPSLELMVYGGIGLTLLVWYGMFNRQFIRLQAAPTKD